MIDLRRVPDLWRRCDVTVRDFPLALLLTIASLLPAFQGRGTQIGELPSRPYDALAILVIALQCLPLTVRRRWPAVGLVLVSLGFALDQLYAYHALEGASRCPSRSSARAPIWNAIGASPRSSCPLRTCRSWSRSTGSTRP